ncbi:MAG TPA: PAS domain S-box protein [Blastocatellia bacterium]|nr:PAS domain S-box protein [Blastocatellia bacterium]
MSKQRSTDHSNYHEEALSLLAAIVESSDDGIIGTTLDGTITSWNSAAEGIYGYRPDEVKGRPISILIPPDRDDEMPQIFEKIKRGERISHYETVRLTKDGRKIDVSITISPIKGSAGTIIGASAIAREITGCKEEEEQLHEQAALLDHAQDAIIVRNLEGRVLYWNKSAERISGWSASEAIGKNICALLYKDNLSNYEAAMTALTEKREWVGELSQRTKDGREIIAECHWTLVPGEADKPASVFAINTDITEKKKLEAQFLRAQRMESIGTLASGIAHNLGNLLSPILLSFQLLKRKFTDEESQHMLAILQINAERAGEMIRQVLEFARGIQGERIELLPTHVMREVASILEGTLPKSIDVELSIAEDLLPVVGDANQLHQVLMNLCVNARDAMPDGGSLTIGGENTYIDENYARMQLEAKPGQYVVISVADTGVGIPADVLGRIFEPFFTTKELGKGTGLGLPTIRAIVKGHDGFINVYSEVGKGTEFRIYIPAATTTEAKSLAGVQPDVPVGHGELILIIDDELPILEVARKTLEENGYKVLTASDGAEGLALYAEHRKEVDAVLIDMVMPYLDGAATIRALRKLDPAVKIIASSGLAANDKLFEDSAVGVRTFLSKPYSAEKLLRALSEILAAQ